MVSSIQEYKAHYADVDFQNLQILWPSNGVQTQVWFFRDSAPHRVLADVITIYIF